MLIYICKYDISYKYIMYKTKTLISNKDVPGTIEELELKTIEEDEVVIKMTASGICHTDISVMHGKLPGSYPLILGHEGVGIVEEVGAHVKKLKKGDKVILSVDYCGECKSCLKGLPTCCERSLELSFLPQKRKDGKFGIYKNRDDVYSTFFGQSSFSTHTIANQRSCVKVNTDLPDMYLAPLGCGIQTGLGTVLNTINPRPDSSICIFGCGPVGLSAICGAVLSGCKRIVAIDRNEEKLQLAKEIGATEIININNTLEFAPVDYYIDAAGNMNSLKLGLNSLNTLGTLYLVGAPPIDQELPINIIHMLGKHLTIQAVIEGHAIMQLFIPYMIELIEQNKIPINKMVKAYPFEQLPELLSNPKLPGIKKVITF